MKMTNQTTPTATAPTTAATQFTISDDKSGKTVATVTAETEIFVADLEESGWRVVTDHDVEWAPGVDASDWASGNLTLDGQTIRQDNLSYSASA